MAILRQGGVCGGGRRGDGGQSALGLQDSAACSKRQCLEACSACGMPSGTKSAARLRFAHGNWATHRMPMRAGRPMKAAGGVRQVVRDHAATPAASTPLPPYRSASAPGAEGGGGTAQSVLRNRRHSNGGRRCPARPARILRCTQTGQHAAAAQRLVAQRHDPCPCSAASSAPPSSWVRRYPRKNMASITPFWLSSHPNCAGVGRANQVLNTLSTEAMAGGHAGWLVTFNRSGRPTGSRQGWCSTRAPRIQTERQQPGHLLRHGDDGC